MGKDIRIVERGKCACDKCYDFMRSDGATCGYCGCLPTRHSKKDARSSSYSVLRHQEGNKWQCKSREVEKRFPNPKGEYTEFSNSILPNFYLSFWTTIASYQTSIISLGVKPLPMAVNQTNSSLELRLSDCLRKQNLFTE